MNQAFLGKMRALRKEQKITLSELADKLSVSKAYVSMIETGRRSLDYKMAIGIADILGCKPDEVFYNDFMK
jgi:transcriptional regulator with XRE-family HTH domain